MHNHCDISSEINNSAEGIAMKKRKWKEPEDKTQWLLDLIDASEAAVKGYEKYLLNQLDYNELARIMVNLRSLLPMSLDEKIDDGGNKKKGKK